MGNSEETIGQRAQRKYGISEDFVALMNIGEAMTTLLDYYSDGIDVPADLTSEVVGVFGETLGYITAKYDPALNED